MVYQAYHLHFNTPVHIGLEGIGQERIEETVRSDTLWGALIQKWLLLFDDDPDILCCQTPFSVSSCFPLINGVRFYPAPINALDNLIEELGQMQMVKADEICIKDVKRIKYLSEEIFFKVLQGTKLTLQECYPQTVYPWPPKKESGKKIEFSRSMQRPRVKIDPLTDTVGENAFFYCTDQYFDEQAKSGLFFLASFQDETARQRLEAALRLLGDSGLDADRSAGRGLFSFIESDLKLPEIEKSEYHVLLSLYHPTRKEVQSGILNHAKSAYALVRRFGYADAAGVRGLRRDDLWLLAEGSVLPFQPKGDAPCVIRKSDSIPHNVYRCGRALALPAT